MLSHQAFAAASDLLIDGFLARTFSPQDVHNFFTLLLRTPNFLQYYHISYTRGAWYVMRHAPPSPGLSSQNVYPPLDFDIKLTHGTVVPQRRWRPGDELDNRRHVEEAALQLPVFFVHLDGAVGFWLPDILQGHDHDLSNRDSPAPLGGRTTAIIRINWPEYGDWKRQIPARDETHERNPITLGRLMRHIGTSVDKFFNQCMASGQTYNRGIGARTLEIGLGGGITQREVKIIGAVHVSASSWMPIIQLTRYLI